MFGFDSLTGGGGLSASSAATSGNASTGNVTVGGINTGTQSQLPSWVWIAAAAVVALYLFKRK